MRNYDIYTILLYFLIYYTNIINFIIFSTYLIFFYILFKIKIIKWVN
jgi:hypothetical protein